MGIGVDGVKRFYLLPLHIIGNRRSPAYLSSRNNPNGQDIQWSLADFGNDVAVAVVATEGEIERADEALELPTDKGNLSRPEYYRIAKYLHGAGVDSGFLRTGDSHHETIHRLYGITQMYQAGNADPTPWLGREIYRGIGGKSNPLDWRMYWDEQTDTVRRKVEPLIVRESFKRNEWGDYLRWLVRHPHLLPFTALPATDAFTGTNGTAIATYSASWTVNRGGFAIFSNAIRPNSAVADDQLAYWNADVFNNNQYAQGTLVALASGVFMGVAVRSHASAHTFYGFSSDSADHCYCLKYVATVYTDLGTGTVFAVNDVIRIEANSTTITFKKNGSTTGVPTAATDSSITSGSAGITGAGNNTTTRLDSWEGGNLTAATASLLPFRRDRLWRKKL